MTGFDIWESDYRFMLLLWEHAPLPSGRVVELCREALGWKKSTTYNAIRRMCEKGLIRNENAMVTVLVSKEQVQAAESFQFVQKTFAGSLPQFLAAFASREKLSEQELEAIQLLIDRHKG